MENEKTMTPAQEEAINTAYDKLLDAATVKANEDGKLTDKQLDELAEKLDKAADADPVLSSLKNSPSARGEQTFAVENHTDDMQAKDVTVRIDPETGASKILDDAEDDIPDIDLSEYLDMKSYEADYIDLDSVTLSDSIIKEYELSDEDCKNLIALLKRVQAKEEGINYYNELPAGVKKFVNAMAVAEGAPVSRAMKNGIAKTCIDTIFREIGADVFQIDVEHLINTEIKKSGVDFSSMYDEMILGKKEKLYEAAAKVEEQSPENAAVLRKIANACEESYMMTGFIEAIRNHAIKIRKIDIEKYDKVVREFNYKYDKSSLNINLVSDLVLCIPRHLATATEPVTPDKITPKTIVAFVVAFCKYCDKFSAENVAEHTFMYYFIKNILRLDSTPPGTEHSEFAQQLVDRIKSTLELIHEVYGY